MRIANIALCLALAIAPLRANAQIVVHTTLASFLAATTATAVDTFDDIARTRVDSPIYRTAGGYQFYSNTGPGRSGFLPGGIANDTWLRPFLAAEYMTFGFFPAPIQAFGGYFFGTDANGAFAGTGRITVTARDPSGALFFTLVNPQLDTFLGFTSAAGLFTVSLEAAQPDGGSLWVSANDVRLGSLLIAVVPEPATIALLAAGLTALGMFFAGRRRKSESEHV
jgi:PEP-CTERM motif